MTRKMILIAGVAGMALTVPALAQKGDNERGKQAQAQRGGGGDGGQQAQRAERPQRAERQQTQQAQRAERPQRQERQQVQRAERPQRVERQMQRAERPLRVERQQRVERPQRVERQAQRQERPQRIERQQQRVERQAQRPERQQQRVERQAQRLERPERQQQRIERNANVDRGQQRIERREQIREARQDVRQDNRQQQRLERRTADRLFAPPSRDIGAVKTARFDGRGYRPLAPVLSTREMIPMQSFASKFDNRRIASIGDRYDNSYNWSPVPAIYGSRYFDNDDYYYRYDNDYGYAYQINRQSNLIGASYPLFGGYGIGDPWPQTYYSSYVPAGYQSYYYDTPDYYYRNDGYGIYQVDAGSQLITALVSLVMGQSYGIGQTLPASYGAYNVPLSYRASYADTDDSWYRYGDGYIYQMDPYSRRVEQRYPLYSDNYYVGQQWPVAYPDYNVPYGYRSAYADSPQYQYRYANGGIYQVDPTNQMILALSALISGDQFAVGQAMPSGYDIYNVPIDYRDRYADSDDEYYRYANGYVYRVDYDTGLIEDQYSIYA